MQAERSLATEPGAKPTQDAAQSTLWLPVDGVISLDEDYTASPAKTKAVAEANEHLHKGDRKAAMEKLKLADVGMSIVQEVVPLQQTITDVHQAATLMNAGKYFEGSQALRNIQSSARFEVATYVSGAHGKAVYSKASDLGKSSPAHASAAVTANGPEPYAAPDPQYKPMTSEPVLQTTKAAPVALTDGTPVDGPAAGPEPYSAPTPQYTPMTSEPVIQH